MCLDIKIVSLPGSYKLNKLDFETYKVDNGGSFELIRPVTRGHYDHQKIKTNV